MLSRMRKSLLAAVAFVAAFAHGRAHFGTEYGRHLVRNSKRPHRRIGPDAKITLTNRATHDSRSLITNESGLFVAAGRRPGNVRPVRGEARLQDYSPRPAFPSPRRAV